MHIQLRVEADDLNCLRQLCADGEQIGLWLVPTGEYETVFAVTACKELIIPFITFVVGSHTSVSYMCSQFPIILHVMPYSNIGSDVREIFRSKGGIHCSAPLRWEMMCPFALYLDTNPSRCLFFSFHAVTCRTASSGIVEASGIGILLRLAGIFGCGDGCDDIFFPVTGTQISQGYLILEHHASKAR